MNKKVAGWLSWFVNAFIVGSLYWAGKMVLDQGRSPLICGGALILSLVIGISYLIWYFSLPDTGRRTRHTHSSQPSPPAEHSSASYSSSWDDDDDDYDDDDDDYDDDDDDYDPYSQLDESDLMLLDWDGRP